METGRDAARGIASRALKDMARGVRGFLEACDAGTPTWVLERGHDLLEIADGRWATPSDLVLLRALREAVAELHGFAIDSRHASLGHLHAAHQAMDIAVSVSGGVADLMDDEHDWGADLPDLRRDAPPFLLVAFESVCLMARDLHDGVAAWLPLSTAARDSEKAVRLSLAMRSLLRSPDGVDVALATQACREGSQAAVRVCATLRSSGDTRGLSAVASYVQDVFEEAESALSERISPTP